MNPERLFMLQSFSWNNCSLRIYFGGIRKRGNMPLYCESELFAKLEQSEAETAKLRDRLKAILEEALLR